MAIFPHLDRKFYSILINIIVNAIFFGATFTIIGSVLPQVIRTLNWNYSEAGFVIMCGSVGYFCSTFVSGLLLRLIKPHFLSIAGLTLLGVSLACFGLFPSVILNSLLLLIMGLGQGAIEVLINYSIVQMEKHGRSQLMNLLHTGFSFGAVLGPLLPAKLMTVGLSWTFSFRILSLSIILLIFWTIILPFQRITKNLNYSEKPNKFSKIQITILVICTTILILYVGAEVGITSWISEYFVTVLEFSASRSASIVSMFWGGVLAGRMIMAFAYRGTNPAVSITVLSCLSTLGLFIALSADTIGLCLFGFIVTGFGFSSIYPLVMSLIGSSFTSKQQGFAIGCASTGGGIGGFIFPFVIANYSEQRGIGQGFLLFIAITILIAIMGTITIRIKN